MPVRKLYLLSLCVRADIFSTFLSSHPPGVWVHYEQQWDFRPVNSHKTVHFTNDLSLQDHENNCINFT